MVALPDEATRALRSVRQVHRSGAESERGFVEISRALEYTLTVQTPKTVLSLIGTYTSYCIVFQTLSPCFRLRKTSIRRRFAEFVWLQKQLVKMDHSRCPPPLCAKRFWNEFDPEFIQRRQGELENWLSTVLSEPLYLSCTALHLFLQTELSTSEIQAYLDGKIPEEKIQRIWANHGMLYNYQPHNPLHNPVHQEEPIEIRFTEEDLRLSTQMNPPPTSAPTRTFSEDALDSIAFAQHLKLDSTPIPVPQKSDGSPPPDRPGPLNPPMARQEIDLQNEDQERGQEIDEYGKPEDEQEREAQEELSLRPESEQEFSPQRRPELDHHFRQDQNRPGGMKPREKTGQKPRSFLERLSKLRAGHQPTLHIKPKSDSTEKQESALQKEQKAALQDSGSSDCEDSHPDTLSHLARKNDFTTSRFQHSGFAATTGGKVVESPDREIHPFLTEQMFSINGD